MITTDHALRYERLTRRGVSHVSGGSALTPAGWPTAYEGPLPRPHRSLCARIQPRPAPGRIPNDNQAG